MTDVARRLEACESFGHSTTEARVARGISRRGSLRARATDDGDLRHQQHRTTTGRNRTPRGQDPGRQSADHSTNGEGEMTIELVVQPPIAAPPGATLDPAMTGRIRRVQGPSSMTERFDRYFVVATLVRDDAQVGEVPVTPGILRGQLVKTVQQYEPPNLADNGSQYATMGYVQFGDLKIQEEGSYRIRITLLQMIGHGTSSCRGSSTLMSVDSTAVNIITNNHRQNGGVGKFDRQFVVENPKAHIHISQEILRESWKIPNHDAGAELNCPDVEVKAGIPRVEGVEACFARFCSNLHRL